MRIYICVYVGYSAILSDNAEVDADIRIRMAIPNSNPTQFFSVLPNRVGQVLVSFTNPLAASQVRQGTCLGRFVLLET